ncbi:MAG: NADH-quinone oxidoreductase subunit NuoK [Caldilineae bacterium]|nr:MAG: NADH-quinone oxidoreductase subunit NuoK [Caldilineae bacterium]
MVPTAYVLVLSAVLFTIGAVGVLVRRNALIIFMCVEMMLNAVNLSLVALSNQWGNLTGQIFVFIVMAVAAVEVAIGLAIVMAIVRHKDTTNVDEINLLKW